MRVLLTGAQGQLGCALINAIPTTLSKIPIKLIATSRAELNLADTVACRQIVKELQPDWIINAGAYTAVDRAENEPELVYAVNAGAPRAFAETLASTGGRLLQLSTNFVFSGTQGHPYSPNQSREPLGTYGASKAAGEVAVEEFMAASGRGTILRTSWVMGPVGHNFALTMLQLHREREELSVIADQVGCPTSTFTLADACWRILTQFSYSKSLPMRMHWCNAGAASWYDVAIAIGELAKDSGLLSQAARVRPITTANYPVSARRPSYSLLDCCMTQQILNLEQMPWRSALAVVLNEVKRMRSATSVKSA
ncbi:dTDP-4-dehydrorhamnose reductase [cyanobiont of Ornithocercus magnificus]|nr:dTDP-4-dehydrorhamnose reductase [cyanobiont of Ornithocercus magnificus]